MRVGHICLRFRSSMVMHSVHFSGFYSEMRLSNHLMIAFFFVNASFFVKKDKKVLWNETKPVPLRTKIWIYY